MSQFAKTEGSGLRVALEAGEADVLRALLREMRVLLEADIPRSDPIVERLFPNAYDTESEQHSYERLVGDELREAKSSALRAVQEKIGSQGPVDAVVETSEIDSWLTVLTDLRLAIGVRLNITEERMQAEIDPADPDADARWVLEWLGWLQHRIIEEITEDT